MNIPVRSSADVETATAGVIAGLKNAPASAKALMFACLSLRKGQTARASDTMAEAE